jgi:pimeloyl-ACP methyl ester carboxylesterase
MVAFAFAAAHQDRTTRLVMMDAPVPGVGPWDEILKNPLLWHFRFGGPDMKRLVAGRERIYLDRFWNEFSADPTHFPEASQMFIENLSPLPPRHLFVDCHITPAIAAIATSDVFSAKVLIIDEDIARTVRI